LKGGDGHSQGGRHVADSGRRDGRPRAGGVAMTKAGVEVDLNRSKLKRRIWIGSGLVGQIWAGLGLEQRARSAGLVQLG
jgi:hypothetical protein